MVVVLWCVGTCSNPSVCKGLAFGLHAGLKKRWRIIFFYNIIIFMLCMEYHNLGYALQIPVDNYDFFSSHAGFKGQNLSLSIRGCT